MVNYQKMYAILCCAASEALDMLPKDECADAAREILQKALYEAEDCFILAGEDCRFVNDALHKAGKKKAPALVIAN